MTPDLESSSQIVSAITKAARFKLHKRNKRLTSYITQIIFIDFDAKRNYRINIELDCYPNIIHIPQFQEILITKTGHQATYSH
jgi:uncharacterized circularly permuted ATP-grasp superfamily protein